MKCAAQREESEQTAGDLCMLAHSPFSAREDQSCLFSSEDGLCVYIHSNTHTDQFNPTVAQMGTQRGGPQETAAAPPTACANT